MVIDAFWHLSRCIASDIVVSSDVVFDAVIVIFVVVNDDLGVYLVAFCVVLNS